MCASRRYNESQMTASGSQTSLVLPIPHQSEVDWTATWRTKGLCPRLSTARAPLTAAEAPPPRKRSELPRGGGQQGSGGDNRGQQSLSPPFRGSCSSGRQSQSSFPQIPSQPWRRYPPLQVSLWKTRDLCAIKSGYQINKEVYNTCVTVCVF